MMDDPFDLFRDYNLIGFKISIPRTEDLPGIIKQACELAAWLRVGWCEAELRDGSKLIARRDGKAWIVKDEESMEEWGLSASGSGVFCPVDSANAGQPRKQGEAEGSATS